MANNNAPVLLPYFLKCCCTRQETATEMAYNRKRVFSIRKPIFPGFTLSFCLLHIVTYLLSCGTVKVYKDPGNPVFNSNTIHAANSKETYSLKVTTFNIAKAEKIQLAIRELQQFAKNRNIDIYLLQEMDEIGVKAIAWELGLNYLYFPIVYNRMIKKNIGNAILTTGTIERGEKLLLPHRKWVNNRVRHVAIGEVNIRQKKILVYSVHTETVMMSRKNRMHQVDTIIRHALKQSHNYKYLVIGGDFNTLFPKDKRLVVDKFGQNGFVCSTNAAGSTATAFFGLIKPTLDYLFTSGLDVISSGKIEGSKSSDHYPVFATFQFRR